MGSNITPFFSFVGLLPESGPRNNCHFSAFGSCCGHAQLAPLSLAIELESTGIKVNAACPGFTATAINNFEGTRTVGESAREPVRLELLGADGTTGTFSSEDGPIPW